MTEIAVTQTTQADPATPPPTPEAANGAPPAAAPPAEDPAKLAEAAKLAQDRQESRDLAQAKAAAFRAQQEAKELKARYDELTKAREADRDRITKVEAWEKLTPEEALAALEERGLTAQQLGRAAVSRGSPEDILKKAEAIAEAKAEAKLKAILAERDTEAKTKQDQEELRQAHAAFIKEVTEREAEYPAMASLVAAGPVLRRAVLSEAMHIYRLAGEDEARGIHHSDEEIKQELEKYLASEYGVITQRISGSKTGQPSSATSNSESSTKSAVAAPNVTSAAANGNLSLAPELPKDFKSWPAEKQNRFFLDAAAKKT